MSQYKRMLVVATQTGGLRHQIDRIAAHLRAGWDVTIDRPETSEYGGLEISQSIVFKELAPWTAQDRDNWFVALDTASHALVEDGVAQETNWRRKGMSLFTHET